MTLEFICGCKHEIHLGDSEDIGWWRAVSTDRAGFLICTVHNQRRKNWNSLPEREAKHLADWSFAGVSPLNRERFEVFGTPIPDSTVKFDSESVEDRRDTRDPEMLGREILAAAAAKGNGHAEDN